MNEGLEAFERLKEGDSPSAPRDIEIVEKELKEKETQDNYIKMLEDRIDNLETTYLRDRKALEIIKNSGVFVHLLQQSRNVEEYNSLMLIAFKAKAERDYKGAVKKFCLTQEEFDLLKKVLL